MSQDFLVLVVQWTCLDWMWSHCFDFEIPKATCWVGFVWLRAVKSAIASCCDSRGLLDSLNRLLVSWSNLLRGSVQVVHGLGPLSFSHRKAALKPKGFLIGTSMESQRWALSCGKCGKSAVVIAGKIVESSTDRAVLCACIAAVFFVFAWFDPMFCVVSISGAFCTCDSDVSC